MFKNINLAFIYKAVILPVLLVLLIQYPAGTYIEGNNWVELEPYLSEYFYKTKEAKRIGDNCLLYQDKMLGGFPKNIYMPQEITDFEILQVNNMQNFLSYCSIDNNATTTEIDYLAKLYKFSKQEKYKNAVIKGINYLINSQYENGGWKQCNADSEKTIYRENITFNDNAMINVMHLLQKVAEKSFPYEFVNNELSEKAKLSVKKGIDCILKTQIKQDNKKTGWCAQYDKATLIPAQGRSYEFPSISGGRETAGILLFLMSIKNPSAEMINSVESGIKWLKNSKLQGCKLAYYIDKNGYKNYKIVKCSNCPPIWARFYEIDSNKPIFASKNCSYTYNIQDISQERQKNYEWYSTDCLEVLNVYELWYKQLKNGTYNNN